MPRISFRFACAGSTRGHHRANPAVPRLRVVNLQVVIALVLIVAGAAFFVDSVEQIAAELQVNGALLALVIAPIATELPEKFNSVIWVRMGKDTLAMGNITGAMVFQATIPTVVALVFAPHAWVAAPGSYVAFASAGIAFLSAGFVFIPMARRGVLRGRGLLVGGAVLPRLPGARDRGDQRHGRLTPRTWHHAVAGACPARPRTR